MKAAISLPDDLFDAADAFARRQGLSRSRLIALALADYLARHRGGRVTEKLDAVYGAEDAASDAPTRAAQRRTLRRSDW